MPRIYHRENLVGRKFNRLTVTSFSHKTASRDYYWNCVCECGTLHIARATGLKSGDVKSCGCLNLESAAKTARKMGLLNKGPREDLTGQRFGRLTVIAYCDGLRPSWVCECDCGEKSIVRTDGLKDNSIKSCGCLNAENKRRETIDRNTTHGFAHAPEYINWQSMMSRCFNPMSPGFADYGRSGIVPCEFIRASPLNLVLLIGRKPTPKHEIDRISNYAGYHCGSCADCLERGWKLNVRWATRKEQIRNRKCAALFTISGETKCASAWAEQLGLRYHQFTYQYRHKRVPKKV